MTENKIITQYESLPGLYMSFRDFYDKGDPIGYGKTKKESIDDLIENEREWDGEY